MKKTIRNVSLLALFGSVSVTALSGCIFGKEADLTFWSSFGSAYTSTLDSVVDAYVNKSGVTIEHISKGSYDSVKEAMVSTLATGDYPNMVTGYPDHFAEYIGNDAVVKLDQYIKNYDQAHSTNLLNDYYSEYLTECYNLQHEVDGTKNLMCLPFNKSTELMGYNGVFVDYAAFLKPTDDLGNVPATWQEWEVKGPKYLDVQKSLLGKYLIADQAADGTASHFSVLEKNDANEAIYNNYKESSGKCALDFTSLTENDIRVISWDSTDNMFITLIRQWGGKYTELPETEWAKQDPRKRHGYVEFWGNNIKTENDVAKNATFQITVDCLKYFNALNQKKIFGVPKMFGSDYSSKAFETNKVMFMLCSSGGLSYNTTNWNQRFRVAPLPYNANKADCKYVISQGADICVLDQGSAETIQKAVDAVLDLTRGDLQAQWCVATGYYPASKSATNATVYQNFLNDTSYDNATKVAYREGSNINKDYYMNVNQSWHKFVDDAFIGSAEIRTKIKTLFGAVFQNIKDEKDLDNTAKYIDEINTVYNTINKDVKHA